MTTKVTHQASGASQPQALVTNFDIDELRAEIERLRVHEAQLEHDRDALSKLFAEADVERARLRAAAQALVDCPLLKDACDHVQELADALGHDKK
jgi:uncharacterized protein YigA (DUF484 family)